MNQGRFLEDLERLNVFRIVVARLVSGWLVLQVVDVATGNIGTPH